MEILLAIVATLLFVTLSLDFLRKDDRYWKISHKLILVALLLMVTQGFLVIGHYLVNGSETPYKYLILLPLWIFLLIANTIAHKKINEKK